MVDLVIASPPDCRHWRANRKAHCGDCAAGHYREPSYGTCAVCVHRSPDERRPAPKPQTVAVAVAVQVAKRPSPTVAQVASFAAAVVKGRYVPEAVVVQRSVTCGNCEHARRDPASGLWCSLCGCKVGDHTKIDNLAAYVESIKPLDPARPLPLSRRVRYGCKHPQREQGRGWPVRGVLSLKVLSS